MTKRPHDEIIGCEPAGERSTIERRRWPSANQAPASVKTAPSSGPRWRSVSVIASATAATAAGAVFCRRSQMPATPHISADPVLLGHGIRIVRAHTGRPPRAEAAPKTANIGSIRPAGLPYLAGDGVHDP